MRIAVIGAGNMGQQHIAALQAIAAAGQPLKISVVADISARSLASVMDRFGIHEVSKDWRSVVGRSDVDIVHICTPNVTHFEIARAALMNGKHVICEKPLALSAAEALELVALADSKGLTGAVCFTYRGYDGVELARQMYKSGELGNSHVLRGGYVQGWLASASSWDWRVDPQFGGPSRAIADIGTHWLDLTSSVTGEELVTLVADLHVVIPKRPRPIEVAHAVGAQFTESDTPAIGVAESEVTTEDYGTVMFRSQNFAGTFTVSQVSQGYKNSLWLDIDGSDASLSWELGDSRVVQLRTADGNRTVSTAEQPNEDAHPEHIDALQRIILSAYAEIDEGIFDAPVRMHATFHDGYRSALLVDAILDSAETGTWSRVRSELPV